MKIILPREQRKRLKAELRQAGSREIGGILMGEQLEPGRFRVVDFSVDNVSGSYAHFVRSPEHHRDALNAFFARTGNDFGRFNYLGEWHSHPNFPTRPSAEDMASMKSLVHGERNISFAVLMIVRLRWLMALEVSALVFAQQAEPAPITIET
jgi:integrative and conjugative element protein (TIGR02256 family)